MHNRVGREVASREIEFRDAVAIVPIIGVILVLAFYPQFLLKRSEPTAKASIATAQAMTGTPRRVAFAGAPRRTYTYTATTNSGAP
jgi:NADH:ubiquinone oxidoreductase subunit 4 (subunit M)